MIDKKIKQGKKTYYFYMILSVMILVSILISSAVVIVRYNYQYDSKLEDVKASQETKHAYIEKIVKLKVESAVDDLRFLANIHVIKQCLQTEDSLCTDEVIQLLTSSMQTSANFDFFTVIDLNGNEKLKLVRTSEGKLEIIPNELLKNKSDTSIFESIEALKDDEIFVTTIDIAGRTEKDQQAQFYPVISIAIPVKQNDECIGYLHAHLNDTGLFIDLESGVEKFDDELMIIDHNGYFYYNERHPEYMCCIQDDVNFSVLYPDDVLSNILQHQKIEVHFTKTGLYTFSPIYLNQGEVLNELESAHFHMVTHIDYDAFLALSQKLFSDVMGMGVGIFLALLILSIFIAIQLEDNYKNRRLINDYATYDQQTGAYNRRPGIDFINKIFKQAYRNGMPVSLAYLDINKLKEFNDTYGHTAGDEVIKNVANEVLSAIRETDILVRVGGDEFIVLLHSCGQVDATRIIEKVNERLSEMYQQSTTPFNVSISYGIVDTHELDTDKIDLFINEADKRMYLNKKRSKLDFLINQLDIKQ
jgi:diguanylate cyclase (GGDEF)-like protein